MAITSNLSSLAVVTKEYILKNLKNSFPELDLSPGSPTLDNVVVPALELLTPILSKLVSFDLLQDLENAKYLTTEELMYFGSRFRIYPRKGTRAYGQVYFRVATPPSGSLTFLQGTTIAGTNPVTGTTLDFAVRETTVFEEDTYILFKNGRTDLYDFPVWVEAASSGSAYNIGVNSTFEKVSVLPLVKSLAPVADFTGGTDQESNIAYATRIKRTFLGHYLGNAPGYVRRILDAFPEVNDVSVVGYRDALMNRDIIGSKNVGGKVDLWIKGKRLESHVDNSVDNGKFRYALSPYWLGEHDGTKVMDGTMPYLTLDNSPTEVIGTSTRLLLHCDDSQFENVTDESTYENNGVLVGEARWFDGVKESGIFLNGYNAGVKVDYDDSLNLSNDFLFSITVIPAKVQEGTVNLIAKGKEDGYTYQLALTDGKPSVFLTSAGVTYRYIAPEDTVKPGVAQTITATRNGTTIHLYINSKLVGKYVSYRVMDLSLDDLYIGYSEPKGEFFHGVIDEVVVSSSGAFSPETFPFGGKEEGLYVSNPYKIGTNFLMWNTLVTSGELGNTSGTNYAANYLGATIYNTTGDLEGYPASNILQKDGEWRVSFEETKPAIMTVDLGTPRRLTGIELWNSVGDMGTKVYEIKASANGTDWFDLTPAEDNTLPKIKRRSETPARTIPVPLTFAIKYLRLYIHEGYNPDYAGLERIVARDFVLTSVEVYLRTATTEDGLKDSTWAGPYLDLNSEIDITALGGRYIQAKVSLGTSHPFVKPTLSNVTLEYSLRDTLLLSNKPLDSITGVYNRTTGEEIKDYELLYVDSDPEYLKDTGRSYYESVYVTLPRSSFTQGDEVDVQYTVNTLVSDIQSYMDTPQRMSLISDNLAKNAFPVFLNIEAKVVLKEGIKDTALLKNTIITNLQKFIQDAVLGTRIDQSEIVSVLQSSSGYVEGVELPLLNFYISDTNQTYYMSKSSQFIQLKKTQYLVPGLIQVQFE